MPREAGHARHVQAKGLVPRCDERRAELADAGEVEARQTRPGRLPREEGELLHLLGDDTKDGWGGEEVTDEPDGEGAGGGEEAERGDHLDVEVVGVGLPLGVGVRDDVDGVGDCLDSGGAVGVVEFLETAGEEGAGGVG